MNKVGDGYIDMSPIEALLTDTEVPFIQSLKDGREVIQIYDCKKVADRVGSSHYLMSDERVLTFIDFAEVTEPIPEQLRRFIGVLGHVNRSLFSSERWCIFIASGMYVPDDGPSFSFNGYDGLIIIGKVTPKGEGEFAQRLDEIDKSLFSIATDFEIALGEMGIELQ